MPNEIDERFEIDCLEIVLTQHEIDEPLIYQGAGSIQQSIEGNLELKLYCASFNFFEYLQKTQANNQTGELVDKSSYFSLAATDLQGRSWTSERIHPLHFQSFSHGNVIKASLEELCCVQETQDHIERAFLKLTFIGNIKIPCNVPTDINIKVGKEEKFSRGYNSAQFSACGNTFILRKEESSLSLSMTASTENLSKNIDLKICEALQFVLARPMFWHSLEAQYHNMKILRIRSNSNQIIKEYYSEYPPIKFNGIDSQDAVWNLFEKYLEYITNYPTDELHPISGWIRTIVEAQGSVIQIQALILAIAVEGIEKEISNSTHVLSIRNVADIDEQILKAQKLIDKSDLDETMKKRIKGSIGAMKNKRPIDTLNKLVKQNFIDKELVTQWSKLRNKAAHASTSTSPDAIHDLLKACDASRVLFHQLVFLIIQYEGKYTDYYENWLLKNFSSI